MTKKRLLRFFPYLTFLFCYGLVTIVGLIPGLLYGNEMGYWLLGFWFILPWSALLCTFFAAFLRLPLYPLLPVIAGSWALYRGSRSARRSFRRALVTGLSPQSSDLSRA